ncbi:2-oxo acid dehydrogenase subunit E2 [Aquihabitans sp. G128]|uniref:dihydrolipoamide acetyltransferase family protein n=1 Tax=Aquihabitans sp. G128 TaxID=2849779 RepID=UPI001C2237A9|nr:dihydrolipoamide acetyltransferase family protein [Aquihabitans sp. G128]QXC59572.1 2-oxo acid dehydrogenase subunit E2 [Aquihabitans sp. G128]
MDVIAMPQLGETVTEGTITLWAKAVGDEVALDDALFEVSTEKVDTEVPSAVAGYLRAILVAEGDTVPIGTAVAVITATADEAVDLGGVGDAPDPPRAPADADPPPASAGSGPRSGGATGNGAGGAPELDRGGAGVLSPAVRRLLVEHGLDPSQVNGSGRDGRITRADVEAAAAQSGRIGAGPPAAPVRPPGLPPVVTGPATPAAPAVDVGDDDEVVDLSRARLATAEHMSRSLATAAHALVAVEVDYHRIEAVRRPAGLSYLPFVARAVVDAIREFPHVNASFDGDRLVVRRHVHLGVAVDVAQEALVVPVVRDADGLRLRALSDAVASLADQARRRRLPGDALVGGTFTLTNVGSYGTFVTAPIINQPQVAILSTDGVRMAPVAVRTDDGAPGSQRTWGVAVHPVGNLCLSFDHRAFDGAYAAAFLARVRQHLQERDWAAEVDAPAETAP